MTDRDRLKYFLTCAVAGVAMLYLLTAGPNALGDWVHARNTAVHTLLELFAITVAVTVVTSAWTTFDSHTQGRSQVFIGGFVVVAVCDVFHVLTYPGMPSFLAQSGMQSTIYFWLMGRSAEAITLGLVAVAVLPQVSRWSSLAVGLGVSGALVVFGTLRLDSFPATYVDGVGLTRFKVGFELTLCAVNLLLAAVLLRQARTQNSRELGLMSLSSLFMALGGLAFASFVNVSDIQNVGGHVFKIIAYALLYRAIFISNMSAPFEALKAAERRNREFQEVMKTLGSNLHNTIIYQVHLSASGRLRYTQVSESIERVLGLKAEDLYRDPMAWTRLTVPQDRALLRAAERRSREALMNFDATVRLACPDGRERRIHFLATPRRLDDGTVLWDGLATDVTERFQAEEARRKLESELNQAQKMESVGTLASGIAHDFNNVLAAILGNTQMVIEDVKNGEIQEALTGLAQVQKSANRAKGLVNQILSFSRKEAPARTLQPVRRVIEETLGLLKTTLPRNIVLDERFEDDNALALIDSTQIEQVVVNLCTNAWHAIGNQPGRIGIHTSLVHVDPRKNPVGALLPGEYIRIRVEDNGCGMDTATLHRVFEPFFTTKPSGQGTGLGMSVVHRIVTSHDGTITVDTSLGGGTRFDIFLPVAEPASGALLDLPATGSSKVQGNGERVLYVDDDPLMSKMVERMLLRTRFRVKVVNDPQVAIDWLQRSPGEHDILVTDYNMPGLTGLQVIRAARAVRPDMPVILLSGYVSDELLATCREQGVERVMEKQKSLDELCGLIEQALERSGNDQPAA